MDSMGADVVALVGDGDEYRKAYESHGWRHPPHSGFSAQVADLAVHFQRMKKTSEAEMSASVWHMLTHVHPRAVVLVDPDKNDATDTWLRMHIDYWKSLGHRTWIFDSVMSADNLEIMLQKVKLRYQWESCFLGNSLKLFQTMRTEYTQLFNKRKDKAMEKLQKGECNSIPTSGGTEYRAVQKERQEPTRPDYAEAIGEHTEDRAITDAIVRQAYNRAKRRKGSNVYIQEMAKDAKYNDSQALHDLRN